MSDVYGVWFEGRNTPAVVRAETRAKALSLARAKKSAGSQGDVNAVRQLKGKALSDANAGKWVRIRHDQGMNDQADTSKGSYKYRPQLKH